MIALDTAGYGPIPAINKSITIAAVPGARAFVVVAGNSNGFTINANPSDLIVIQNISFNGSNTLGSTGVFLGSGKLTILDCDFSQLGTGVWFSTGRANLITSKIQANIIGIYVTGAKVEIIDCLISHNNFGIRADNDGGAQNNPPNGSTLVRVDGGSVTLNTTAFQMQNPGLKPAGGANGQNLFLRVYNGVYTTNVIDNTTFLLITGNMSQCGADPCAVPVIGTYMGQGL